MTSKEIQDETRRLLQEEFSGGAKFTELIAPLVQLRIESKSPGPSEDGNFVKQVELAIEDMQDVGMLQYGWPLGPGVVRQKLFVYLKLYVGNLNPNTHG